MSLAAKALTKAIAPLTGGVVKELSGYLGDQVRFLRWKSAVHILKRARLFCDEEKLAPEKIPIKFLVPFLEGASFEDICLINCLLTCGVRCWGPQSRIIRLDTPSMSTY